MLDLDKKNGDEALILPGHEDDQAGFEMLGVDRRLIVLGQPSDIPAPGVSQVLAGIRLHKRDSVAPTDHASRRA